MSPLYADLVIVPGGNTAGTTKPLGPSGQVMLAGGNNITLSQNGNTVSIVGGAGGAGIASAGMSNVGNTSGTSGLISQQLVLAGGNNVTLSQSVNGGSATVTISAGAGGGGGFTDSQWNPYNEAPNTVANQGQGTLHIAPLHPPGDVQFNRVLFPIRWTNATNSTGSVTISMWMGFYTRNVSTLSLLHSSSTSQGVTFSGAGSSASLIGMRLFSMGWTTTITDGRYYVGIISRTTSGGANATISQVVISAFVATSFSGLWGAASAASIQWPLGLGVYSATTSALPASIAFSQMQGTQALAAQAPSWHVLSQTA